MKTYEDKVIEKIIKNLKKISKIQAKQNKVKNLHAPELDVLDNIASAKDNNSCFVELKKADIKNANLTYEALKIAKNKIGSSQLIDYLYEAYLYNGAIPTEFQSIIDILYEVQAKETDESALKDLDKDFNERLEEIIKMNEKYLAAKTINTPNKTKSSSKVSPKTTNKTTQTKKRTSKSISSNKSEESISNL